MGDIDLSDDGRTLYFTNLNERNVYGLNIGNPATTPTSATRYDLPATACTNGLARPWGLKFHDGVLYAGVVCTGENEPYVGGNPTRTNTQLSALVYAMDTTAATPAFSATPVINFSLNFARGCATRPFNGNQRNCAWNPWTENYTDAYATQNGESAYPSPILSGIDFDTDGAMILSFSDRWGMQLGSANLWPNGTTGESAVEAGDLLRAWPSSLQQWTIESGGDKDGPGPFTPTISQMSPQGPGGGEFYYSDIYNMDHEEIAMGAIAVLPGSQEVAATVNDPIIYNASGTKKFSSITGAASNGYQLRRGQSPRDFGKSAGLGDLELICNPAPLEIGNRVWIDANRNGIQDAGESNFPGVEVVLTDASGNTYTATTNNTGEYYFNNSNVTGGLKANQTYTVTIDTAQPALASYKLTAANVVTAGTTLTDGIDSDGMLAGAFAQVAVTLGSAGQNDHTVDFGFYKSLFSLGNRVWFDTNDDGATSGPGVAVGILSVLMQLVDANGTVLQTQLTDANGYYRFDNVPAGTYDMIVAASNFQTSGPLAGYRNSSGVTTTTDLGSDNHDHGLNTSPNPSVDGVASVSVTLGLGLQPTGETAVGGGTDGPHGDANSNLTLDFGFNRQQLGNQLWFDTNNNGIFDAGELPLPAGVIVNLHAILFGVDSIALTATTNANGQYEFQADNNVDYSPALVAAGALTIYVAIPAGQPALNSYIPSTPRQTSGGIDNHNVGALDATGLITSGTFYLFPGDTTNGAVISDDIGLTDQPTFDFGFVLETYSVGNRVWYDTNNNGIFDAGEQPIAGVSMNLLDGNGDIISTTLTDATGYYRFDNLLAGTYAVKVDDSNFAAQGNVLFGYRSSTGATASSANTADDNHDHGINTGHPGLTGLSSSQFALGHGLQPVSEAGVGGGTNGPGGDATDNLTIDFGFYKLALGNLVWIDQNNNGVLDSSDGGGLDGVTVRLYASDGITEIPVGPDGALGTADDANGGMLTHNGGQYEFSGLTPGDYIVKIDLIPGFVSSSGTNGQDVGAFEPASDPDNNIDNDDNGTAGTGPSIRVAASAPVTLVPGSTDALSNTTVDAATGSTTNPTVDFGVYNDLVLGNLIWDDLNNNGLWDKATEPGIDGVKVNLYFDANGDGDVDDAGETTPISSTTTANNGLYLFLFLPPGNYVVELAASNFNAGSPLEHYTSSTGVNGGTTGPFEAPPGPDTSAIDNDDNGSITGTLGAGGSIRTPIFNLEVGQEPTNENPDNEPYRLDQNENLTVDFGVFRYAGLGDYT